LRHVGPASHSRTSVAAGSKPRRTHSRAMALLQRRNTTYSKRDYARVPALATALGAPASTHQVHNQGDGCDTGRSYSHLRTPVGFPRFS
jgi:hypothetical protein